MMSTSQKSRNRSGRVLWATVYLLTMPVAAIGLISVIEISGASPVTGDQQWSPRPYDDAPAAVEPVVETSATAVHDDDQSAIDIQSITQVEALDVVQEMESVPDVLLELAEAVSTPVAQQFDADKTEIDTDIEPLESEPLQTQVSSEQVAKPVELVVESEVLVQEPKVLVVEPDSPVWWLRLAMDEVDQLDSQQTQFTQEAILTAAHLFAQTGDVVGYRQTLDLWLARHVLTPQRRSRIVKLQLAAGDIEGARQTLDDIPADSVEYVAAWCAVAISQYAAEDLEGSSATIVQVRQALALINDPARLHDAQLALVRTLVAVNDLDAAATQAEALDDQDVWTTRSGAASLLAEAYLTAGSIEQALQWSSRINDKKLAGKADVRLVRVLAESGRYEEASRFADSILTARYHAQAHLSIVLARFSSGDRRGYRKNFAAAIAAISHSTPEERLKMLAQVVRVQLQGGLHVSAQETLTHIEHTFAADDDEVIAILDELYLEVIADHARRRRFLQAITILQSRIRRVSAKDRGYVHIAIAQAQGGALVAARRKVTQIHDPAIKAAAYRQLAAVWAKDQDAQKVRQWIDALEGADQRLMAFIGVGEELSGQLQVHADKARSTRAALAE